MKTMKEMKKEMMEQIMETEKAVDAGFKECDTDGDGKISWAELQKCMADA